MSLVFRLGHCFTNTHSFINPPFIDIGGAVFGGLFVAFSGSRIAATIACSFFIICLLTALFYAPNKTMTYLNLGFALATLCFILFDWFVFDPFIQFVCLYYGVTIGSFSVYDTIEDTVTSKLFLGFYFSWLVRRACPS